jgi:hypothetical protein
MGECSPARKFSGEGVQMVDGELAPVMNGGEKVVYRVQQTTAISNMWSSTTCIFPRQRRGAARGDGGFGGHRRARKTARKTGARLSIDTPERGEKERELEGRGGGFTASESTTSGSGTCELRRAI